MKLSVTKTCISGQKGEGFTEGNEMFSVYQKLEDWRVCIQMKCRLYCCINRYSHRAGKLWHSLISLNTFSLSLFLKTITTYLLIYLDSFWVTHREACGFITACRELMHDCSRPPASAAEAVIVPKQAKVSWMDLSRLFLWGKWNSGSCRENICIYSCVSYSSTVKLLYLIYSEGFCDLWRCNQGTVPTNPTTLVETERPCPVSKVSSYKEETHKLLYSPETPLLKQYKQLWAGPTGRGLKLNWDWTGIKWYHEVWNG